MVALPPRPMPTVDAIYRAYEAKAKDDFRDHLGASVGYSQCKRAVWYSFRWFTRSKFSGRILRLFETGNKEEQRFVDDLRSAGVQVWEVDPATGEQWKVRDETGHFGGSMDGEALGLKEAPNTKHICEFKTHNDKSFKHLLKHGVKSSKPQHWYQMQVYMGLKGIDRCFYLAKNKNDDDLYSERVKLDVEKFARMVAAAQRIIRAHEPPEKISTDPTWHVCRMCPHHGRCHGGELPERHCRSCLSSTPITEGAQAGTWCCERHGMTLDSAAQRVGCARHRYIPAVVPGTQTDAELEAGNPNGVNWIEYDVGLGVMWKDEGK